MSAPLSLHAALLPTLDASIGASRGRAEIGSPVGTRTSAGLQAAWELDLFGAARAGARDAIEVQRERVATWIALNLALGGGWSVDATQAQAPSEDATPH